MLEGWVCPKCSFVWSPFTVGCQNCNIVKTISCPTITWYPNWTTPKQDNYGSPKTTDGKP